MKCPECLEKIHDHAEECPHCGMTLERLSANFEGIKLNVNDGVHDVAGVLSLDMRKQMQVAVHTCEKQFIGVNLAVSFVALRDHQTIETYGFWLLNNGMYLRSNKNKQNTGDGRGRVLLVLDVETKRVGLSYGYYFDRYIREKENFDVLSSGHASLLEGEMIKGCEQIFISLKALLKVAVQRAKSQKQVTR